VNRSEHFTLNNRRTHASDSCEIRVRLATVFDIENA
jgi:hypothetical protein